jgi:hypothetical protein
MDSTTALLAWTTMGFATGLVALYKGRVGRTWFFLGFLLGPIALGAISIQKPKDEVEGHEPHSL